MNDLRLILIGSSSLGKSVNDKLNELRNTNIDYVIPIVNDRFNNGEGKITIKSSVREKDVFILADVGNYSITYNMHGLINHMSPDEHFQDIKRVISAMSGHASRINVIMPLLYQSRQHKRKGRESLDSACALRELENLGVSTIITFDTHDASIVNAIPNLPFDNIYPTKEIINEISCKDNILVVSPDMGAMERARYYAEYLGCDIGVFYKRRDLSRVVNGKNPVIEHVYMGKDVKGINVYVVDDMIASGASMLEVAKMLKEKGAKSVNLVATFALFTEGVEEFAKGAKMGYFDKLYTTNLSYIPEEITSLEWVSVVDMSLKIAEVINDLNLKKSLERHFEK